MKKGKQLLSLALVFLLCLALLPASAGADSVTSYTAEVDCRYDQTGARSMLAMVNALRTGEDAWQLDEDENVVHLEGLSELQYSYALEEIAMQRAIEVALSFSHTRPDGTRCFTCLASDGTRSWGENIAAGSSTAAATFEQWCETDEPYAGQGHRRNMLGSFAAIGIAHVVYGGTHYWVQEFSSNADLGTEAAPLDAAVSRRVEISADQVASYGTPTVEPETLEMAVGDTVPAPTVSCTLTLANAWGGRAPTVTITPQWEMSNDDVLVQVNGYLTAQETGGVFLSSEEFGGQEVSVPVTVGTGAAGNACGDDATWELEEDGTLHIRGTGPMWDYKHDTDERIPCLDDREAITALVIDEGITSLGDWTCQHCTNLTSVSLPETLERIGDHALYACTELESIQLPDSLTTIAEGAFRNSSSLDHVTIPAGVTEIGDHAFGHSNWMDTMEELRFTGPAPHFGEEAFYMLTATAYYPADDPTWTEEVRQNYGPGEITWVPYDAAPGAEIYSRSVSLTGNIALNVYVYLPDALLADEGAYAMLNDTKLLLAEAPTQPLNGRTLAALTLPLAAKEMNDPVTLRLFDGEGNPVTLLLHGEDYTEGFTTTIMAYIDAALPGANAKLKPLLQAMADYGSCAQDHFDYNTENRAAVQGELDAVTPESLAAWAPVKAVTEGKGLRYLGASLFVESETTIRHYLALSGSAEDYLITVDGAAVTPVQQGSFWVVDIPNISARNLDTAYTLSVTKDGEELLHVEYSALSYAWSVLNSDQPAKLQTLVKALFLYNQAANAYFGG